MFSFFTNPFTVRCLSQFWYEPSKQKPDENHLAVVIENYDYGRLCTLPPNKCVLRVPC